MLGTGRPVGQAGIAAGARVLPIPAGRFGLLQSIPTRAARVNTTATGGSAPGVTVSLFVPGQGGSGNWWPAELGAPAATGAQNQMRYAYFPYTRRLAVEVNGQVTVYDTLNHQLGGFSQQQSGDASITFTSQYGLVALSALPVVSGGGAQNPPAHQAVPATAQETDIFATIERLAELKQKGVLTEEEFNRKKADLLSRL